MSRYWLAGRGLRAASAIQVFAQLPFVMPQIWRSCDNCCRSVFRLGAILAELLAILLELLEVLLQVALLPEAKSFLIVCRSAWSFWRACCEFWWSLCRD